MKFRYILIFCILICSLVLTLGKRAKEKETTGKEKDKEKPEKGTNYSTYFRHKQFSPLDLFRANLYILVIKVLSNKFRDALVG